MIIGHTFYGQGLAGNVYDTAIPTPYLDEVVMSSGIYDELYITLDSEVDGTNEKPDAWSIKDIMDAKFLGNLEGGTLSVSNNQVTAIQIYRRRYNKKEDWLLMGEWPYNTDFNVYTFIDRLAANGTTYEYGILPVAGKVLGDLTKSPKMTVNFDGVYVSNTNNNYHLEVNYDPGTTTYHTNKAELQPLNGEFPVVVFGSENYRSGTVKFVPLSKDLIHGDNDKINPIGEKDYRQNIVNFINDSKPKVLRDENGEVMLVVTSNLQESSFSGGRLQQIKEFQFDFTEVGRIDYQSMLDGGLIGTAGMSNYIFSEDGNAVIIDKINAERRGITD